jgi:hypothetical protein
MVYRSRDFLLVLNSKVIIIINFFLILENLLSLEVSRMPDEFCNVTVELSKIVM